MKWHSVKVTKSCNSESRRYYRRELLLHCMVAAVGCSDLAPPSDAAWLKRVDDQITIGCYMSRQSWQLNCVNGVWTGTVGVCGHNSEHSKICILIAFVI